MKRIGNLSYGDCIWVIDKERVVHKKTIRLIVVTTSLGSYIDTNINEAPITIFVPIEFKNKSLFRFHKLSRPYILVSDPHFLKFWKYFRIK